MIPWHSWQKYQTIIGTLTLITLLNSVLIFIFSRLAFLDHFPWLERHGLTPFAPICGGILLCWLYFRHQGHTQVGLARVAIGYHVTQIPISWLDMSYQFFGALIAILSGFAVGVVGPAIYLSGWLASRLAARVDFTIHQQRLALACGCATAIAVLFGSPLGAMVLVTETIIRRWELKSSLIILFCAALATGFGLLIGGSVLTIHLPRLYMPWSQLSWFVTLGLLAAISVWVIQKIMQYWPIKSIPLGFMAVAVVTSLVGLWEPGILGLEAITPAELLAWQGEDHRLWVWFALRTLLSGVALAALVPGGSFGPALVVGGLLGASMATIDGAPLEPILIVAGMAAVLGVVLNAPLAATILMVEHCQQWQVALPTLIASLVASVTLKYLLKSPSLLDFQLQQQEGSLLRLSKR